MTVGNLHLKHRTLGMMIGLAIFVAITYLVIIPTVVARNFLARIDTKTAWAKADLKAVSTGPNIVIFQDPDIPLAERRVLIARALASLHLAQHSLDDVRRANTLPRLPGDSFGGAYRTASVRQARTVNAVQQSQQVLHSYASALEYVDAYTEPQLYLNDQLAYVNSIRDFGALAGQGSTMSTIAAHLMASHDQLAARTPPPAFAPLHEQALQTLAEAAAAFGQLDYGLNQSSDEETYSAVAVLEHIALQEDVGDKQSLTQLAQSSPTVQQLTELAEKIEYAQQQ